jgi:outer membrane biosynthesis protein TonB
VPAGLSRRTLLVAALVFAGALGVGYVVSSPGSAKPAPEPVGSTAVPLDVPAASGGEASLGKVEALPALARQPAPPPPAPEPVEEGPPDEPVEPGPVDDVPFVPPSPPPVPTPQPAPTPPPPPPPVDFDDSG